MPELESQSAGWQFWTAAMTATALGVWLLYRGLFARRAKGKPRCRKCWYDLRGALVAVPGDAPNQAANIALPLACPECGKVATKRRHLYRTRRRWLVALLGLSLISGAWYSFEVRYRLVVCEEPFVSALTPSTLWIAAMAFNDDAFTHGQAIWQREWHDGHTPTRRKDLWPWQEDLLIWSFSKRAGSDNEETSEEAFFQLETTRDGIGDVERVRMDVIRRLIGLLDHPTPHVRARAATSFLFSTDWNASEEDRARLQQLFIAAAPRLREMTSDPDPRVREEAWGAMAAIGPGQFAPMSDEALCAFLKRAAEEDEYANAQPRLLVAAAARKSPLVRDTLESLWNRRAELREAWSRVEVLVALRRLQGLADPIRIELVDPPPLTLGADDIRPRVRLRATNVDTQSESINLLQALDEDQKSLSWTCLIHDASGKLLNHTSGSRNGSPVDRPEVLNPGEWVESHHQLWYFLDPGEYTFTFVFHSNWLDARDSLDSIITQRSEPIRVIIHPGKSPASE